MKILSILLLALFLASCSIPKPLVERIKDQGVLTVVTRNSPTTYYKDRDGPKGLEYELVQLFAAKLGVTAQFITPKSVANIIPWVVEEKGHFAAAGLSATKGRETRIKFAPAYQKITQQLIYLSGHKRPKKITDTIGGTLEVLTGSSHEEELIRLKEKHPDLIWTSQKEMGSEELLYLVKDQVIDYTIADSNEAALSRRFYPDLKVAFDLTKTQPLAWGFPHAEDSSLFDAASEFIHEIEENGILKQLLERHYGHVEQLGFVDTRAFERHIQQRLPPLTPFFKKAAEASNLDWELLAAIGYQESHWNPKAVSPTGVRGIMMLTQGTADQLKIRDRTDPEQSILGGARYLRIVEKKIPERIQNPDRLWLALAGYNVGFGHLEDARVLTERNGKNQDKWVDIKQHLPLLTQKKYFSTVKYGFARGKEPVKYVDNIRSYHDLLLWHNNQQQPISKPKPKPKILLLTPAAL